MQSQHDTESQIEVRTHPIMYRIVKSLDIAILFGIWTVLGFLIGKELNKLFPVFIEKKYNKKNYITILLEVWIQFACVGIIVYVIRNIIELIPSMFENKYGFTRKRLKELNSTVPLIWIMLYYQDTAKAKLTYLHQKRSSKTIRELK